MSILAVGDSNTLGYGLSIRALRFPVLLQQRLGGSSLQVIAGFGDQAGDLAFKAYGHYAIVAGDVAIIAVGTNDQWKYAADSTKRAYFASCYRALVLSALLKYRVVGRSSAMTVSGSWGNTYVNAIGRTTTAQNAKLSATVSGRTVYVGSIYQADSSADSTATVTIDGVNAGQIRCYAPGINTYNGMSYPPAAHRFAGLSAGPHVVEVTVTSAGKHFYLDYIAGSEQDGTGVAYVVNVPRLAAVGYAALGGSDANVAAYNTAISDIVAELVVDGFAINLVDAQAAINTSTHLQADGVHYNTAGHQVIADALSDAMGLPPTFSFEIASVYIRNDGRYFVGTDANRREIQTL